MSDSQRMVTVLGRSFFIVMILLDVLLDVVGSDGWIPAEAVETAVTIPKP